VVVAEMRKKFLLTSYSTETRRSDVAKTETIFPDMKYLPPEGTRRCVLPKEG
jgi:hypothetical protein